MTGQEYLECVDKKYRYLERLPSRQREGRGDYNRDYDIIPSRMMAYELVHTERGKVEGERRWQERSKVVMVLKVR